jgi:hypothetical protein
MGTGDVADVVHVKNEDCTESLGLDGGLCLFETLPLEALKIDTCFPIGSHCSP